MFYFSQVSHTVLWGFNYGLWDTDPSALRSLKSTFRSSVNFFMYS